MDYHTVHGHDVEGFGTPLTHRVLTVSAADVDAALLNPSPTSSTGPDPTTSARLVPTSIPSLDLILSESPASAGAGDAAEDGDEVEMEAKATTAGKTMRTTSDAEPPSTVKQQSSQKEKATRPHRSSSGLRLGQLTEIWGPPGAGKTAFGMQLAANALSVGSSAVWVDCFHSLCRERLTAIVKAQTGPERGAKSLEEGLIHYACPSLPHFIAMFCPSPSASTVDIPADASVVVIDCLSALVNYALPKTVEKKGVPLMANGKRGPAAHEKRTQVLQYIIAALERLAETRNLAIVLLTQCASRVQADGGGAALVPAINAAVWDRGIATRIVLFRDWAWKDGEAAGGRFAGIQKLNRNGGDTALSHVIAFSIAEASPLSTDLRHVFQLSDCMQTGLVEEDYSAVPPRASEFALKRKLGEAGLEANSDDENYGWDDQDSMPNMPSQWQGSEDLLLGRQYDSEEEEGEEGGEDEDVEEGEERGPEEGIGGLAVEEAGEGSDKPDEERHEHTVSRRSLHSVADSEEDSDY